MKNPTPKRRAKALPGRECAPQEHTHETRTRRLTDARMRELHARSQGIQPTGGEHRAFLESHRAFIDDIFNDAFDRPDLSALEEGGDER